MIPEVNQIAQHWPDSFKQAVSYLFHFEPLTHIAEFIPEENASDLQFVLNFVEDAQICTEMLMEHGADYDAVHDWSLT